MEFTTKQIQYPIGKQCQNDDCRWTMPAGYEATQIKNDCSVFCSIECAQRDYEVYFLDMFDQINL